MSKTIVFGACTLGLALLAGCSLYVDEPDPPVTVPPAPPPSSGNVSNDEYDPANHRLLLGDCTNHALLSVDLATGERSVLIDTWPWTEPDNWACVRTVIADPGGRLAFATVSRGFPEPGGNGGSCDSQDLVVIDTETRAVTEILNIDYRCSDNSGPYHGFDSLQLDSAHARLLHLELDCPFDWCSFYLSATPFGGRESMLLDELYTSDCWQTGDCTGESRLHYMLQVFDPTAPDSRVLMLVKEYASGAYYLESLDLATNARGVVATIPTTWTDFEVLGIFDASVDAARKRVLLTAGGTGANAQERMGVLAIDLVTGEQTLLYDGSPAADGSVIRCYPTAAFDSKERRLLLIEPRSEYGCAGGIFAVDPDSGAFTRLYDGTSL
jgi:hypothetical protein